MKRVAMYDKDSGELLDVFPSIKAAAASITGAYSANISACCRGGMPSAYGYKWRYYKLPPDLTTAVIVKGARMPKNCFRCFASCHYDFGGESRGFQCRALPHDRKIVSNVEGRSKRRDDCPLVPMLPDEKKL